MEVNYESTAKIMKALSDRNRIKIIDMLSCGERCGCEILEEFKFTQPTLSHHMKVLSECGLVNIRKEGLWCHYSLNQNNCNKLAYSIMKIITKSDHHEPKKCTD